MPEVNSTTEVISIDEDGWSKVIRLCGALEHRGVEVRGNEDYSKVYVYCANGKIDLKVIQHLEYHGYKFTREVMLTRSTRASRVRQYFEIALVFAKEPTNGKNDSA